MLGEERDDQELGIHTKESQALDEFTSALRLLSERKLDEGVCKLLLLSDNSHFLKLSHFNQQAKNFLSSVDLNLFRAQCERGNIAGAVEAMSRHLRRAPNDAAAAASFAAFLARHAFTARAKMYYSMAVKGFQNKKDLAGLWLAIDGLLALLLAVDDSIGAKNLFESLDEGTRTEKGFVCLQAQLDDPSSDLHRKAETLRRAMSANFSIVKAALIARPPPSVEEVEMVRLEVDLGPRPASPLGLVESLCRRVLTSLADPKMGFRALCAAKPVLRGEVRPPKEVDESIEAGGEARGLVAEISARVDPTRAPVLAALASSLGIGVDRFVADWPRRGQKPKRFDASSRALAAEGLALQRRIASSPDFWTAFRIAFESVFDDSFNEARLDGRAEYFFGPTAQLRLDRGGAALDVARAVAALPEVALGVFSLPALLAAAEAPFVAVGGAKRAGTLLPGLLRRAEARLISTGPAEFKRYVDSWSKFAEAAGFSVSADPCKDLRNFARLRVAQLRKQRLESQGRQVPDDLHQILSQLRETLPPTRTTFVRSLRYWVDREKLELTPENFEEKLNRFRGKPASFLEAAEKFVEVVAGSVELKVLVGLVLKSVNFIFFEIAQKDPVEPGLERKIEALISLLRFAQMAEQVVAAIWVGGKVESTPIGDSGEQGVSTIEDGAEEKRKQETAPIFRGGAGPEAKEAARALLALTLLLSTFERRQARALDAAVDAGLALLGLESPCSLFAGFALLHLVSENIGDEPGPLDQPLRQAFLSHKVYAAACELVLPILANPNPTNPTIIEPTPLANVGDSTPSSNLITSSALLSDFSDMSLLQPELNRFFYCFYGLRIFPSRPGEPLKRKSCSLSSLLTQPYPSFSTFLDERGCFARIVFAADHLDKGISSGLFVPRTRNNRSSKRTFFNPDFEIGPELNVEGNLLILFPKSAEFWPESRQFFERQLSSSSLIASSNFSYLFLYILAFERRVLERLDSDFSPEKEIHDLSFLQSFAQTLAAQAGDYDQLGRVLQGVALRSWALLRSVDAGSPGAPGGSAEFIVLDELRSATRALAASLALRLSPAAARLAPACRTATEAAFVRLRKAIDTLGADSTPRVDYALLGYLPDFVVKVFNPMQIFKMIERVKASNQGTVVNVVLMLGVLLASVADEFEASNPNPLAFGDILGGYEPEVQPIKKKKPKDKKKDKEKDKEKDKDKDNANPNVNDMSDKEGRDLVGRNESESEDRDSDREGESQQIITFSSHRLAESTESLLESNQLAKAMALVIGNLLGVEDNSFSSVFIAALSYIRKNFLGHKSSVIHPLYFQICHTYFQIAGLFNSKELLIPLAQFLKHHHIRRVQPHNDIPLFAIQSHFCNKGIGIHLFSLENFVSNFGHIELPKFFYYLRFSKENERNIPFLSLFSQFLTYSRLNRLWSLDIAKAVFGGRHQIFRFFENFPELFSIHNEILSRAMLRIGEVPELIDKLGEEKMKELPSAM